MSEYAVPTPKLQYHCDRDDRLRIHTLFHHARFTKDEIALQLNLTIRQIEYALQHRLTPQKRRSGRRPFLGPAERQQLIEWVCASKANRRTSWYEIPAIFGWDCHIYAIQTAFKLEGFKRCTALKKPDLTAQHAAARLAWALEHINWTYEDWAYILWSDESWIQPGKHKKVKVTRRSGEALHKDCVEPKYQRKIGWMLWGCISGLYGKGPSIFWEKSWGKINSQSYLERIAPMVQDYCLQRGLLYMQDNASSHAAKATIEGLESMGIKPIYWPAKSPDLNPIETLWDIIKDYIAQWYPNIHSSYHRLKAAVLEAWDKITEEQIRDLIQSMPARCRAVIEADGWYTKF